MKKTYFEFPSQVDKLVLKGFTVEPDEAPRAVVMLAHGLMEHKERYETLMERFAENGFACAIIDQRGYGESIRSVEDLGHSYGAGASGMLKDLRQLADMLIARYPGKKLFLYGHSMGSLCMMDFLKRWGRDVNGAILCALPANNKALGAGKAYLKLKKRIKGERFKDEGVKKLMFDNYASRFKGESSPFCWLSSDKGEVSRYEQDPLCGQLGTVDGYLAVLDLMDEAYSKKGWDNVSAMCPVFLPSGADDPCSEGEKGGQEAEKYLKSVGLVRAEHKSYEHLRHEIFAGEGSDAPVHDMINKLIAWM